MSILLVVNGEWVANTRVPNLATQTVERGQFGFYCCIPLKTLPHGGTTYNMDPSLAICVSGMALLHRRGDEFSTSKSVDGIWHCDEETGLQQKQNAQDVAQQKRLPSTKNRTQENGSKQSLAEFFVPNFALSNPPLKA